jgi:hypothetical protein
MLDEDIAEMQHELKKFIELAKSSKEETVTITFHVRKIKYTGCKYEINKASKVK